MRYLFNTSKTKDLFSLVEQNDFWLFHIHEIFFCDSDYFVQWLHTHYPEMPEELIEKLCLIADRLDYDATRLSKEIKESNPNFFMFSAWGNFIMQKNTAKAHTIFTTKLQHPDHYINLWHQLQTETQNIFTLVED